MQQLSLAVETMVGLTNLGMRVFHVEENDYCGTMPRRLYELSLLNIASRGALVTGTSGTGQ